VQSIGFATDVRLARTVVYVSSSLGDSIKREGRANQVSAQLKGLN
jgi:hypothetical protein